MAASIESACRMKLQIVHVPARTSLHWLQLGWRTFFRQPLSLGLVFLLSLAIQPIVTLVLMVAADQVSAGRQPTRALLRSAWRAVLHSRWGLLGLCALYVLGCLLIVGLTTWIGDIRFGYAQVLDSQRDASLDLLWTALAATLLLPFLTLLFWHAPALIHWHGQSPLQALMFSASALGRNWHATALFLLLWMMILATCGALLQQLITHADSLTGPMAGTLSLIAVAFTSCVISVLYAVFLLCLFFSFRDCFCVPAAPPPEPANRRAPI